jgi:hypothetical protein
VHYTSRTGAKVIGAGSTVRITLFGEAGLAGLSASREINTPPMLTGALIGKEEMHTQLVRTTPDPHLGAWEQPVIGRGACIKSRERRRAAFTLIDYD